MRRSSQTQRSGTVVAGAPRVVVLRPHWLGDALLAIGFVAFALGVVAMAVSRDWGAAPWYAGEVALLAAAGYVRAKRPDHPLPPWFCAGIGLGMVGFLLTDLVGWAADAGIPAGQLAWLNLAAQMSNALAAITVLPFIALFPTGEVRGRLEAHALEASWLLPVVPCLVLVATPVIALPPSDEGAVVANPMHITGFAITDGLAMTLIDLINVVFAIAAVLLVRRYRRSSPSERQSIRWLLLPVMFAAFMAALGAVFILPSTAAEVFTVAMSAVLGLSVALALLQPAGIDVDEVLRASLLYGLLWLLIAGAYTAVSELAGVEVGEWASLSWAVSVALLAALALQPFKTMLRRRPGRWLFGSFDDPRRAITRLGESLAETYDLETLLPQIGAALEEGLGVQWARVRLNAQEPLDDQRAALAVPIVLDNETLGVVEVGPKLKRELTDDDEAMVATLAAQAALAVRNVKLAKALQDRTTELTASRARLVRAEEIERRRIERNIHDGAQQELVALIGQSGRLRRRLNRDGVVAADDLEQLQSGLQQVLVELRQLSAGIHPSLLRDRGLLTAIEALAARHPVPTQVRTDGTMIDERLPTELEGAGYFTVAESLANSLKHANAEHCVVTLSRNGETMSIRIDDDGNGFVPHETNGNGLGNLSERLAAIGGVLTVSSQPGHGTSIAASMPLPSPSPRP